MADSAPGFPRLKEGEDARAQAAPGWLDAYPVPAEGGDLFGDAPAPVAARWHAAAASLGAASRGGPAALQEAVARNVADLGLTFRMTGEDAERAWPMSAMPLIVTADEWAGVEEGLVQRAELLERLAADIYGPQRLVTEGHLPAALIAGSPFFARKMLGRTPAGGRFVHIYAADLVRGPRGQWRVLKDRVRMASGIGYALENRLALGRAAGDALSAHHVRRLASFFSALREGIVASCGREQPRIALLTPGRYNQSYAEQAHLARYLGLPLVEGRDLGVSGDRLSIGTISGPRRVDAVWRWITTSALDPLAFDAKSQLGVAGLFDAWSHGGVEIVNRPGTEVLESPALAAFLPRLCTLLMDEAPLLPNVATWWCGQAAEASTVAARLEDMALVPAFGQPVEGLPAAGPVEGAALTRVEREALLEALWRRPMDYCGQEIVRFSTTPALVEGRLEPRPFSLRVFVARGPDGGWTVMPGGFARLFAPSTKPGRLPALMGEGDLSADVWIVDDAASALQAPGRLAAEPPITRGGAVLAAQAADNLYWFGRYNERAETTVRILRSILGGSIEVDGRLGGSEGVLGALSGLLADRGAVDEAALEGPLADLCHRALVESTLPGGVAALLRRRQEAGLALRERFALDFWRIVTRPLPQADPHQPRTLLDATRTLCEGFSALAGLAQENMVRGPAWRFLNLGTRVERALGLCRIARSLMEVPERTEALGALLDLADSQIVYRSRYLTGPSDAAVHDLVLLDPENPRSLLFQVAEITGQLGALPRMGEDGLPEEPLRVASGLLGQLQAATAAGLTPALLDGIAAGLQTLSEAVSNRYFLQDAAQPRFSTMALLE